MRTLAARRSAQIENVHVDGCFGASVYKMDNLRGKRPLLVVLSAWRCIRGKQRLGSFGAGMLLSGIEAWKINLELFCRLKPSVSPGRRNFKTKKKSLYDYTDPNVSLSLDGSLPDNPKQKGTSATLLAKLWSPKLVMK
jgi:hypothetical protein